MADVGIATRAHATEVVAGTEAVLEADRRPLRVALVGVPNSGKSLVFHRVTGTYTESSNCPHTTNEVRTSRVVHLGGRDAVLLDTPGILGLEFSSEHEAPTRQLLEQTPPDLIVQCVDAGRLAQSLMLTAQLADLEIPLVLALCMADEAMKKGLFVDAEVLSSALGVPVVPVCALDGRGVARLRSAVGSGRRPRQVPYPKSLADRLSSAPASGSRAQRLARLQAEPSAEGAPSPWDVVLEAHHHWAHELAARSVRTAGLGPARSAWDLLGRLAMHPVLGWLFLVITFVAAYLFVSEVGVKILADGFDRLVVDPATRLVASWAGEGFLGEILVGDFGLLSLGLFNALGTVLPILAVFYFFFGFLEDIGYFPLLSVHLDRALRLLGLNGKAVLSICLGFGCNAVAAMSTRGLDDGRQRFIASFLIALGVPCAVQLGVLVAILATVPVGVLLVVVAAVGLVQLAAGSALARILPDRHDASFLLEIPPLRPPRWGLIAAKTVRRLREFLVEATPLFLASAACLLVLELTGLLDRIRTLFAPVVVTALGLPTEFADTLLITLARREVGAVMFRHMAETGALSLQQVFVGLLVMTLFVPCLTTTLVMGRVLGWKKSAAIFVAVTGIAIGAGAAANGLWACVAGA